MGKNFSGIFDKHSQKFIFYGCQMNFFLIQKNLSACKIDPKIFKNKNRLLLPGFSNRLMTHGNTNPGHELPCTKRFRQIIISSCIERFDLLLFMFTCRNHDYWNITPLPKSSGYFQPVNIRQSQIKQYYIWRTCSGLHKTFLSGCRFNKTVSVTLQDNTQ